MEWTLKDVIKETDHPFLNFYTLVYEVKDENGKREYRYYMASRNDKERILAKTHDYTRPSGVMMALYYLDPATNEVSIMLTKQFRPPMGDYMTSIPAGLIDEGETVIETAIRESKEEAGVEIEDIELLCANGASSSGMTDETNAIVLARIKSLNNGSSLEEFEDITATLTPLRKVKEMLFQADYHFPLHIQLLMLYLLKRFGIE